MCITNWLTAIAALVTACFSAAVWCVYRRQLYTMKDALEATRTSAVAAAANANGVIQAERAYVAMAHTSYLLKFDEPDAIWFEVQIRNHGRTPGTVLGGAVRVVFGPIDHQAPETLAPDGTTTSIAPAFLVPNKKMCTRGMVFRVDSARIHRATQPITLHDEQEPLSLWLMGYVDYRDQFGESHRGGYGRRWDRDTKDLVFDRTTAAFNFDRPLSDEERLHYDG